MNVEQAVNLDDLRLLAKRRLPKIAVDFIEGGVDDELCLKRNREAFARYTLLPRYLNDVSTRDQSATLMARSYAHPFGISPMGILGLFRPDADLKLAQEIGRAHV